MARGVASKEGKATKATAAEKTKTVKPRATKSAATTDLEKRISERAYRLWEEEGRPEGKHDQHWAQAREIIALEDSGLPMKEEAGIDPGTGVGEAGEPNQALENTGEFPGLRDQGDESPRAPRRKSARSATKPASAS